MLVALAASCGADAVIELNKPPITSAPLEAGSAADVSTDVSTDVAVHSDASIANRAPSQCSLETDCSPYGLHCDLVSRSCVRCLTAADCTATTPVCAPTLHSCVRSCTVAGDCAGLSAGICHPTLGICVQCLVKSDCKDEPLCNTTRFRCVECLTDAECTAPRTCGHEGECSGS